MLEHNSTLGMEGPGLLNGHTLDVQAPRASPTLFTFLFFSHRFCYMYAGYIREYRSTLGVEDTGLQYIHTLGGEGPRAVPTLFMFIIFSQQFSVSFRRSMSPLFSSFVGL